MSEVSIVSYLLNLIINQMSNLQNTQNNSNSSSSNSIFGQSTAPDVTVINNPEIPSSLLGFDLGIANRGKIFASSDQTTSINRNYIDPSKINYMVSIYRKNAVLNIVENMVKKSVLPPVNPEYYNEKYYWLPEDSVPTFPLSNPTGDLDLIVSDTTGGLDLIISNLSSLNFTG
ncbi:MAG: hypothetical protein V2B14_03860 [bacterium]